MKKKLVISMLALGLIASCALLYTKIVAKGPTNTLEGIVTRKFMDCVGGTEMDKSGKIVPIKDISCDGGSTITVNYDETFITETGYVPENMSYSVDVKDIETGDRVVVKYGLDSEGYKTLNCEGCTVQEIK